MDEQLKTLNGYLHYLSICATIVVVWIGCRFLQWIAVLIVES